MSAVLKEKPEEKKVAPLIEKRMQEREYKVTDYVVDVEVGITPDDLEEPAFWAFVAPQLKMGDAIEVRCDDLSWIASYRVIWAERNFARVQMMWHKACRLNMEAPPESVKHEVEFKGGTFKWCVVRLSDGEILQKEIPTKRGASDWLRNYETTMGR